MDMWAFIVYLSVCLFSVLSKHKQSWKNPVKVQCHWLWSSSQGDSDGDPAVGAGKRPPPEGIFDVDVISIAVFHTGHLCFCKWTASPVSLTTWPWSQGGHGGDWTYATLAAGGRAYPLSILTFPVMSLSKNQHSFYETVENIWRNYLRSDSQLFSCPFSITSCTVTKKNSIRNKNKLI